MAQSQKQQRFYSRTADAAAESEQAIQHKIDQLDHGDAHDKDSHVMQAGLYDYPSSFTVQHLAKPGHEAVLDPAPMYDAPGYKGSGKLQDKVALITGGDSGIGRSVAVLYAREGADIAIHYCPRNDGLDLSNALI